MCQKVVVSSDQRDGGEYNLLSFIVANITWESVDEVLRESWSKGGTRGSVLLYESSRVWDCGSNRCRYLTAVGEQCRIKTFFEERK